MVQLTAKPRAITGKKVKGLRKAGEVPAVLYGAGEQVLNLSVPAKEFSKIWKSAGETSLVALAIEGNGTKNVLIHEVALHPIKDTPVHVDFYAVRMDKTIEAQVPLKFIGDSEAVKAFGGILVKVAHELEIEALPNDLPHEIEVDLSLLKTLEDQILVKNIKLPKGVTALGGEESVIALVEPPRSEADMQALESQEPVSLENIELAGKKPKAEEGEAEVAE